MPLQTQVSPNDNTVTIKISNQFTYSIQKEFRESYQSHVAKTTKFLIDLSGADYMDSAALGMLMLLKKHADNTASKVVIYHPSQKIEKLLLMAKFDKFFAIDH
ncbi:MAG: STAS domain-containing protein [Gammaproteobacteria bacterium]|nr:STAS domain-containing protein [Gammaproteobacteria bacterium]